MTALGIERASGLGVDYDHAPPGHEADDDAVLEAEVTKRLLFLRADGEARKRLAAAEAAEIELPPVTSLGDLLAEPDDPVRMRIERVWPSGGAKVLCAGQAGVGKTTLNGNLIRSMADGELFLGEFAVHQRADRIVLIDNEMNTAMLKRWLRHQGIENTDAVVDVVCLRGQAGLFDLGNDRLRDMWTRRLADLGCDFLIFDCLSPVINAMNLKEATELGKFLHPLTDMLRAAGVTDVLVHHHMGHDAERARGDSTALGWSDANWKMIRSQERGGDARYFSTDKVRDADELVPEGLLSWDSGTGRLTYAGGNRSDTRRDDAVEQRIDAVLNVLADNHAEGGDGMNTSTIKTAVGGKKEVTDRALRALADEARRDEGGRVTVRQVGRARIFRITQRGLDPMHMGNRTVGHSDERGLADVVDFPTGPTIRGR